MNCDKSGSPDCQHDYVAPIRKIDKKAIYWNESEKKNYVDMDDGREFRELELSDWVND